MQLSRILLFAFALGLSLVACKTIQDGSDLKHDLGRVKNDSNPWQWHELSFAEAKDYIYPEQKDQILPLDNPMVQGLQKVVDRLETYIRSLDPQGTKELPWPRLMIRQTPEDNAQAELVYLCLPMKMRFEGTGSTWIDRGIFIRIHPQIDGNVPGDKKTACKYLQLSPQDVASLMQWEMAAYPDCSYRIGTDEIVFSESCRKFLYAGFRSIAGAKEIALIEVTNWLTVYSGSLVGSTEEEVATVLAHELAHFHFAHIVSAPNLYNVYYKLGNRAPATKPKPDPAFQDLGEQISKVSNLVFADEYPAAGDRVEGGFIFGIWSHLLPSLLDTHCKQITCPAACQDLQTQIFAPNKVAVFGDFPLDELPDDAMPAWTTFDRLAKSCAAGISIADSQALKPALLKAMSEFSKLCQDQIKDFPTNMALKDWLPWLETQHQSLFAGLLAEYQKLAKNADVDQLGQYTFEQEADEAGLEWSTALGISPDLYLDQRVQWMKASNEKSSTNKRPISTKNCLLYLKQNWKDDQGMPVIVSPGNYAEPHQQPCYRVFTVSREMKVHKYRQQGTWQPLIPNWESLVKGVQP